MLVEINCDMGEGFGLYRMGDDQALMPFIDVANVACGFHAADPTIMRQTVRCAKDAGVKVGAHPSLPDLQGFGRREMKVTPGELSAIVLYQVGALQGFLRAEGMSLNHIKPHGALYGMTARDEDLANAICDSAVTFGVPLIGMPASKQEVACRARGVELFAEFYADLDYGADGGLLITKTHDARDPKETARRCLRAVEEQSVEAIDGSTLKVRAETICIHSDTPNAVDIARSVAAALRPYLAKKAGRA